MLAPASAAKRGSRASARALRENALTSKASVALWSGVARKSPLIASGAALASHEHKWSDSTLQVKIGLVALVVILIGVHMRRPQSHVLDGLVFALSLAIVWLGIAVAHF